MASGATFPVGVSTVTYTATDAAGNTTSCSFTITVVDNIPPAIACPANISVNASAGTCGKVVAYTAPVGTDNCSGVTTARTVGLASGATFPVGVNTVTYTATDVAGNTSSCSFTITVVDNIPPSITCPANIIVTTNSGCNATGVVLGLPTASDNCGVPTVTNNAPASYPLGATTVTWTATDAVGNTSTCMQTVTVTDNLDPIANCKPATISLDGTGNAAVSASAVNNGSTDNCTIASIAVHPNTFTAIGAYTAWLIVTDIAGNVDSCSTTITVVDNNAPHAVCKDTTLYLNASGSATITSAELDGGSTDNGFIASLTAGRTSFDCAHIGANNDTLFVTDNGGNTSFCVAIVTVIDTIKPVIACPANINAPLDAGACHATANYGAPTATDNCSGTTTVRMSGPAIGTTLAPGSYTVTYRATDASGNTADCSFNITVVAGVDHDGDGICDNADLDDDNDGIPDTVEGGDLLDSDGDGIPNRFDLDSDNDGIYDVVESGSAKPYVNGVLIGAVTPAGIPVSVDANANNIVDYTVKDTDGDGIIDSLDLDSDGDGCLDVTEAGFIDSNGDGTPGHTPVSVNSQGVVTSLTP
ncbi:MAG: HYR domain-containing protein [Flavobacteriales bacterium]|nr:HYR domain-containing protein [Flavobacteriales bacterium]